MHPKPVGPQKPFAKRRLRRHGGGIRRDQMIIICFIGTSGTGDRANPAPLRPGAEPLPWALPQPSLCYHPTNNCVRLT